MSIAEFLLARIAEDEVAARATLALRGSGTDWPKGHPLDPARILAECSAKRAIVKFHEDWPVLVEREPSPLETPIADLRSMTFRVAQQIAWLTEREYVKRFGTQPPTGPMLRALAAVYADHPDYREEWKP